VIHKEGKQQQSQSNSFKST